jgi:hypothetical protein
MFFVNEQRFKNLSITNGPYGLDILKNVYSFATDPSFIANADLVCYLLSQVLQRRQTSSNTSWIFIIISVQK